MRYGNALLIFMGAIFFSLVFITTKGGAETVAAPASETIQGKVSFKGKAPTPKLLVRDSDPFCAKTPMKDESVLVNRNGTLKNAVVRIVKGVAPLTTPPDQPVIIDQVKCMYRPRVVGTVVNQKVFIRNSDASLHNVHGYEGNKTLFNRAQVKGAKDMETTFKSGVIQLKCDVHPWMTGWVIVNETPFISVTGDSGEYAFKNLPAGTYVLEVWHEKYGTKTAEVVLAPGKSATADFTLQP